MAGAVKQLQRDQSLEPRIPRAIHHAVRAAPDDVQQIEMAPTCAIGHEARRRLGVNRQQLMQLAVPRRDLRHDRELLGRLAVDV
jgi:hypothetical protein